MKNIKYFLLGIVAVLLIGAAATKNKYVGTFTGNGAGLTNNAGAAFVAVGGAAGTADNITVGAVLNAANGAALTNASGVAFLASANGSTTNVQLLRGDSSTNTLYFTNGVLMRVTVP